MSRYSKKHDDDDDGAQLIPRKCLRQWAIFVPVVLFVFFGLMLSGSRTVRHRPHPHHTYFHPQQSYKIAATENPVLHEDHTDRGATTLACKDLFDDFPAKCLVYSSYPTLKGNAQPPMPTPSLYDHSEDTVVVDIPNLTFQCKTMHDEGSASHKAIMEAFARFCSRAIKLCDPASDAPLMDDSAEDATRVDGNGKRPGSQTKPMSLSLSPLGTDFELESGRARRAAKDVDDDTSLTPGSDASSDDDFDDDYVVVEDEDGDADALARGGKARQGQQKAAGRKGPAAAAQGKKQGQAPLRLPRVSLETLQRNMINEVHVVIRSPETNLTIGANEEYQLNVPAIDKAPVTIMAETTWGALHALNTLLSLIKKHPTYNVPVVGFVPIAIVDSPRTMYRGLLLDTARHFYPVDSIKALLDALELNHFNVFHWHMTDDQSFPIELKSHPELAAKGSFGKDAVYSQADVRELVHYAALRGITIVPEIDIPGHSNSWTKGLPSLSACPSAAKQVLDPLSDGVDEVLHDVFSELVSLFPGEYFHVGCDEFTLDCWDQNEALKKALADARPRHSPKKLMEAMLRPAFQAIADGGKIPVMWVDAYHDYGIDVPEETVLQHWNLEHRCLIKDENENHKSVQSTFLYLDWEIPIRDLFNWQLAPAEKCGGPIIDLHNILGMEAAVWSERIDASLLFCRAFPRAIAIAERLWTYDPMAEPVDEEAAILRLNEKVDLMEAIGFPIAKPADLNNGGGYCDKLPEAADQARR